MLLGRAPGLCLPSVLPLRWSKILLPYRVRYPLVGGARPAYLTFWADILTLFQACAVLPGSKSSWRHVYLPARWGALVG